MSVSRDDVGINQVDVAGDVRRRNDLDRDGVQDQLAGTIEDAQADVRPRDYERLGREVAPIAALHIDVVDRIHPISPQRHFAVASKDYPVDFEANSERELYASIGKHAESVAVDLDNPDQQRISPATLDAVAIAVHDWDKQHRDQVLADAQLQAENRVAVVDAAARGEMASDMGVALREPQYEQSSPVRLSDAQLHEENRVIVADALARGIMPSDASIREPEYSGEADIEALRRVENQQRDIDPDSEATMLAKEDRKRAEFAGYDAGAVEPEQYTGEAERADAAQQQMERDRADQVTAPEDYVDVAHEEPTRWTVQEFSPERGVYVDFLQTDSASEADLAFTQSAGRDSRVLDNELGDYAAEWRKEHPQALPERSYHERSDFQQLVVTEQRLSLQSVLDRRAELEQRLDQSTESMAVAIDQGRTPGAVAGDVHRGYETTAIAYAAAKRDLEDFEAKPSNDAVVAEKYAELRAAESDAESARRTHANARIDASSLSPEMLGTVAAAERQYQERVEQILQREGVTLPPSSANRSDNSVERALSEEQIDALMKREKPVAQASETPAPVAAKPVEGHNQVRDFSAFADAAARDKLVPETVANAYRREGEKFLDPNDPKRVAFVDKGNRLQTVRTFDDKAVSDMIETADARGWTEITVKGDDAFRRKAWIEATARGIEVKGYEPTQQDKQRADTLGKQTGHANAIEENASIKAYRAVRDGSAKEKTAAAAADPEIKKALAFDAAAKSFAKQRLSPDDQDKFIEQSRVTVERAMARGESIPEIRRRQEKDQRQDLGMER